MNLAPAKTHLAVIASALLGFLYFSLASPTAYHATHAAARTCRNAPGGRTLAKLARMERIELDYGRAVDLECSAGLAMSRPVAQCDDVCISSTPVGLCWHSVSFFGISVVSARVVRFLENRQR